jgi:predicted nucleic acid-binding protein
MSAPRPRPTAPRRPPERAFGDTNIFVALLVGPEHSLHIRALDLFRRVGSGELELIVTSVIVAELVHFARSVAGWTRQEVGERLAALLEADGVVLVEGRTVRRALDLYAGSTRLDFPDAYLAAAALETGPAAVASFDSDFDRVAGVRRIGAGLANRSAEGDLLRVEPFEVPPDAILPSTNVAKGRNEGSS